MRRLADADLALLTAIEHRADVPLSRIAKLLKIREHTARFRFCSLKRRGLILNRVPFVDMYRLGFTVYKIYCSLNPERQPQRKTLLAHLKRMPQVIWLAELGGEFQIIFSICCAHVHEAAKIRGEIIAKFGSVFTHTQMVAQLRLTAFGRRYLYTGVEAAPTLVFGADEMRAINLDEVDHRILSALCMEEYVSDMELSRKLRLPLTTFVRRTKSLSRSGVIRGFIWRYDTQQLGVHRYNLLVTLPANTSEVTASLLEFCRSRPRVVNVSEVLGAWNYEIVVDLENPQDVSLVERELWDEFGGLIVQIRAVPLYRSYKYNSYALAGVGRAVMEKAG